MVVPVKGMGGAVELRGVKASSSISIPLETRGQRVLHVPVLVPQWQVWNLNEAELPRSLDHYQSELITGEERSMLIHFYSPVPSSEVRSSL